MTVNNNLSVFKVVNSIPWKGTHQHGGISKHRSAEAGELIKKLYSINIIVNRIIIGKT